MSTLSLKPNNIVPFKVIEKKRKSLLKRMEQLIRDMDIKKIE